jgi:hypothetical protein
MSRTDSKAEPLHRMFADAWRNLRRDLFSSYRPELHYMRGPGPKWREKHARPETAAVLADAMHAPA